MVFNRAKKEKFGLILIIVGNHEKNGVLSSILSASNLHEEHCPMVNTAKLP